MRAHVQPGVGQMEGNPGRFGRELHHDRYARGVVSWRKRSSGVMRAVSRLQALPLWCGGPWLRDVEICFSCRTCLSLGEYVEWLRHLCPGECLCVCVCVCVWEFDGKRIARVENCFCLSLVRRQQRVAFEHVHQCDRHESMRYGKRALFIANMVARWGKLTPLSDRNRSR